MISGCSLRDFAAHRAAALVVAKQDSATHSGERKPKPHSRLLTFLFYANPLEVLKLPFAYVGRPFPDQHDGVIDVGKR